MGLTKRLVERFTPERQLGEIWKLLKALGGNTSADANLFDQLPSKQQTAELWDAIRLIYINGITTSSNLFGREIISLGESSITVVFDTEFENIPKISFDVEKPTSESDNIFDSGFIVNETGFTVYFNGEITESGYYLHWEAKEIDVDINSTPPASITLDSSEITLDNSSVTLDHP